ncbi:MAG: hypothetical protein ACM3XM_09130 [Mycobacterium leprae]
MTDFEHDPVTDEAAYHELQRFFTDVHHRMTERGSSPMRIALATRVSRNTLENYFTGVKKGSRFRITEDTARRLAGWAELDLKQYGFGLVPRRGFKREPNVGPH